MSILSARFPTVEPAKQATYDGCDAKVEVLRPVPYGLGSNKPSHTHILRKLEGFF